MGSRETRLRERIDQLLDRLEEATQREAKAVEELAVARVRVTYYRGLANDRKASATEWRRRYFDERRQTRGMRIA